MLDFGAISNEDSFLKTADALPEINTPGLPPSEKLLVVEEEDEEPLKRSLTVADEKEIKMPVFNYEEESKQENQDESFPVVAQIPSDDEAANETNQLGLTEI